MLKKILGAENVTVVSDYQTYTTSYGKRLYPHKNQLEYIAKLDVDYIVLAGPVISKYFLPLWKDILLELKERGVGYMILSAGTMKLDATARCEVEEFFKQCPPFVFRLENVKPMRHLGNTQLMRMMEFVSPSLPRITMLPARLISGSRTGFPILIKLLSRKSGSMILAGNTPMNLNLTIKGFLLIHLLRLQQKQIGLQMH